MELARELGVHPCTIRRWRKKTKVKSRFEPDVSAFREYKSPSKKLPKVTDPKIWDNREWFEEYYVNRRYGILKIKEIIGRSVCLVYNRLRKYGIEIINDIESDNSYCDEVWLREHYENKKWTLRKCAEAAGVNRYTIYNWLVKFDIEIRDNYEAQAIRYNKQKSNKRFRLGYTTPNQKARTQGPTK